MPRLPFMLATIIITLPLSLNIASAQRGGAAFTIEGSNKGYDRLQDAVSAIGGGQGTIVIAPGHYKDCAIQQAGQLVYQAMEPGTAIFDGGICEGKAALVLRGQAAKIDGLVFQNMRVPDKNGAGIRLEKGNLDIENSLFRNSEQGLLTADDPSARITIRYSTFSRLGRCDGGFSCAHSIYIGKYGTLIVENSRFEKGNGGHYVKSRSSNVTVTGSSFDDTQGKATNYMIDLPAGSRGTIAGNKFVQGKDKENYSAFIAVSAEGGGNSSTGLRITDNDASIAPGVDRDTIFVANWSRDTLALGTNRLGAGLTPYETR
jgi:Right handed beta helix region